MVNGRIHDKREFKRRLRAIERYFFRRPHANVVMVAKIRGAISPDQLKSTLSKLRKRHPLLGVRISLDKDNIAWFTSEGVPELPIQLALRTTNNPNEWIQKAIEEQKILFPLDKGPLIRFVLLQSSDISDLIINCHHTICDGLSLVYLIRDILLYLGNPEREVELLPDPTVVEKGTLPPTVSVGFFPRMSIEIINRLWARKDISFNEEDYKILHRAFWKEAQSNRILSWELTESETSALVSRCRKEKVTVNTAIVTAFLAAQRDVQGNSPSYLHTVSMPVSIRNRLTTPVGEAFGLYFSSFKIRLVYAPETSFWTNTRAIHERIKRRLTDKSVFAVQQQLDSLHPSLVDSFFFSRYNILDDNFAAGVLRMTGDDRINTGLDISNLGRFSFPVEYGSLRLEAIVGPCNYSDFQEKYLGVITIGGKMFFSITFGESVIDTSTVKRIQDSAMKHLADAIDW